MDERIIECKMHEESSQILRVPWGRFYSGLVVAGLPRRHGALLPPRRLKVTP